MRGSLDGFTMGLYILSVAMLVYVTIYSIKFLVFSPCSSRYLNLLGILLQSRGSGADGLDCGG